MKLLKISLMLLLLPVLLVLQIIVTMLDRVSGFCSGLLTTVLFGFLIHYWALGSRDNVILLVLSMFVSIGILAVLKILSALLQGLTAAVIS